MVVIMAEQRKTIPELFSKREARTEFDAIHPRFAKEDPEAVKEFQIRNDYYCESCDQFFAPTVEGLKTHFKGDMVRHRPIGSCYYCNGDVFEYTMNSVRQLYHSCRDQKTNNANKQEASDFASGQS